MAKILKDIEENSSTKTGRSRPYFAVKEISESRLYLCSLCEKPVNGTKSSNLAAHMEACHKDIYDVKIRLPDKTSEIYLREKRLKLLQICVKKTTIDKEPFASILKVSFQELIANKLKKFTNAGIPLNLTNKNLTVVKDHIRATANKTRIKIKNETKGRLLSLMIDGASKHHRQVLGISAQYIYNGQLKIRMLGLKELTQSHTAVYLGAVVRSCIEEYNCEMGQIISNTTDNAANLTKMTRDMNSENDVDENQTNRNDIPFVHMYETVDPISCDIEIEDLLKSLEELEVEELNEILEDCSDNDDDTTIEIEPENIAASPMFVNHVNCGAHTIQLIVSDALKELRSNHYNVIKLCRQFAKFLRRPTTIVKLNNLGIRFTFPKLDCSTRWNSLLILVNDLIYSVNQKECYL